MKEGGFVDRIIRDTFLDSATKTNHNAGIFPT